MLFFIVKLLVKVKFANIINIASNKEIIPELLQSKCNSKNIFNKVNDLLEDFGTNIAKQYSFGLTSWMDGFKERHPYLTKENNIQPFLSKKTKLIWIETPTNPTLTIVDIENVVAIAKEKNILVQNQKWLQDNVLP